MPREAFSVIQRATATAVALGVLTACGDLKDPAGPEHGTAIAPRLRALASAQLAAAAQGRNERGFEDWILRLESRVPGVGGAFTDASGTTVVLVQANADRGRVRSELAAWSTDPALGSGLRESARAGQVEFRPATYAFSDLVAAQNAILPTLARNVRELVSTDADEQANRVRVRITDASARSAVEQIVKAAGIPADAVVIEQAARPEQASNVRGTFRPTAGGLQTAFGSSRCTLGFNVTTEYSFITNPAEVGFLTASHCVSGDHSLGSTGETIYSPIVGAGFSVGIVWLNSPWNDTDPLCGGMKCTTADALFVRYNDSSNNAKKVFITEFVGQNYAGGSITTTGWWTNVQPPIVASVGQSVDKIGRTTGWTRGSVAATCANQTFSDPSVSGGVVMDLCVNRVTGSRVGSGDSGSPVYLSIGGSSTTPLYPVGILFGGGPMNTQDVNDNFTPYCTTACDYWYTPWAAINARLGRTFSP